LLAEICLYSSVNVENLSVNEIRSLGCKEYCGALEVLRVTPSTCGSFGIGYEPKVKDEGFIYKNFIGTYTLGPLFIRNPYLTDYFVKRINFGSTDTEYHLIVKYLDNTYATMSVTL